MKSIKVFFLVVFCLFALSAMDTSAFLNAQVDYFLKIEGIEGESADSEHKGWINIESFSQAMSKAKPSTTGTARRRGAAIVEDLTCVKELDKSSPKIQEACAQGKRIPIVHLELRSGRRTYYKYELTNVLVTSYSISGTKNVPTEEFSLTFEKIKVTYTASDQTGKGQSKVEFTWNRRTGQGKM